MGKAILEAMPDCRISDWEIHRCKLFCKDEKGVNANSENTDQTVEEFKEPLQENVEEVPEIPEKPSRNNILLIFHLLESAYITIAPNISKAAMPLRIHTFALCFCSSLC